jgi:hypothetical protein
MTKRQRTDSTAVETKKCALKTPLKIKIDNTAK